MKDDSRIVKEAVWFDMSNVELRLRVTEEPLRPGTGDHYDPPDMAEDSEGPWFAIWYSTAEGEFMAGEEYFATIEKAMAEAERKTNNTLRWTL